MSNESRTKKVEKEVFAETKPEITRYTTDLPVSVKMQEIKIPK